MRPAILAAAVSAAFLMNACWAFKKDLAANEIDRNAPVKLCLLDNGIEPAGFTDCVRGANDREALEACYPEGKKTVVERCILQEQARQQISTHTTSCYPALFGGTTCTSQ